LAFVSALVAGVVFFAGAVQAQSYSKTGTIPATTNGDGIAQQFHAAPWNEGGFFCRVGSFIVWPASGPCLRREATITFTVLTGGGSTNAEHSYSYQVFCEVNGSARIRHSVAFDGASLTPIDSGTFTFPLSGGDTIQLVTTEGPQALSAPGVGGPALIACAAALLVGMLWFLRRRAQAGAPQ
jgi:hypothetical protein